ncbi:MAG: tRNA dihydrouridine synthase DusB [Thermodesulfobacteriota bacterium]
MSLSPLRIGPLTIDHPFILAPLAGYTDLPFRLLCHQYGAGLCYSEMISCHGLVYNQEKTREMTRVDVAEGPVALQLFGAEPEVMAQAAAILAPSKAAIIDINMGCPVRKVIKKGAGAALMKQPRLARTIIEAVVKEGKKPVTVKFRTGWNHHSINAPEFAQMAEDAGAAAVAIHARTWTDGFSGEVDYQVLSQAKAKVTIPVIANGDILSYEEGLQVMAETGCDGVMIGRGALGRPWIFSGNEPIPSLRGRLTALQRHLELIAIHSEAERLLGKVKNHAGKYLKGVARGAVLRHRIYEQKDFSGLQNLVDQELASAGGAVKKG